MTHDRREFLKRAAAVAAGSVLAGDASGAQQPAAAPNRRALDAVTLTAVGDAVLPETLGTSGRVNTVRAFSAWLAAYRPVAEEMHGYGDAEIRYTPADPAPGWNAQLEALDLLARRKFRRGFATIDISKRRDLIAAQIDHERARLTASPLDAVHVAVALLAFWADSSAATDLVYGARIGKGECRVLADAPRRPLPLGNGGRS
jgi:hypothetical protein